METTRRGFLKSIGLFTTALVAAPSLLLPKKKPEITWRCWEEYGVGIVNPRAGQFYIGDAKVFIGNIEIARCESVRLVYTPGRDWRVYKDQVCVMHAPKRVFRKGRAEEKSTFIPRRMFLTS